MRDKERIRIKNDRFPLHHTLSGWSCAMMGFVFMSLSSECLAQYAIKWMDIGSFQDWYMSPGSEYVEGRVLVQQDGDRWPRQFTLSKICKPTRRYGLG